MFETVLKMNLTGNEKELFYLVEFLGVKVDESSNYQNVFTEDILTSFSNLKPKDTLKENMKKTKLNKDAMIEEKVLGKLDQTAQYLDIFEFKEVTDLSHQTTGKMIEEPLPEKPTRPRAPQMTVSRLLDIKGKELSFNLVSLPESYFDCYNTFIYKSCDICQKTQSKNNLVVCLICSAQLCSHHCSKQEGQECT